MSMGTHGPQMGEGRNTKGLKSALNRGYKPSMEQLDQPTTWAAHPVMAHYRQRIAEALAKKAVDSIWRGSLESTASQPDEQGPRRQANQPPQLPLPRGTTYTGRGRSLPPGQCAISRCAVCLQRPFFIDKVVCLRK